MPNPLDSVRLDTDLTEPVLGLEPLVLDRDRDIDGYAPTCNGRHRPDESCSPE